MGGSTGGPTGAMAGGAGAQICGGQIGRTSKALSQVGCIWPLMQRQPQFAMAGDAATQHKTASINSRIAEPLPELRQTSNDHQINLGKTCFTEIVLGVRITRPHCAAWSIALRVQVAGMGNTVTASGLRPRLQSGRNSAHAENAPLG